MSRFIVTLEIILGVISFSIFLTGVSPFVYIALSPFLFIIAFPFITVLMIWPYKDALNAWKDAFSLKWRIPSDTSLKIWIFSERTAYIGGFSGLIIGCSLFLYNIEDITIHELSYKGIDAALGMGFAILIGITITLIINIFIGSKNKIKDPFLKMAFENFSKLNALTIREQEIIMMIVIGKSNKEISSDLFIAENTVKNHIFNIFQKSGVKSRSELISHIIIGN